MKGFVVGVDKEAFHGVGGKIVEGKFGSTIEKTGDLVFGVTILEEVFVGFAHLFVGGFEQEVETSEEVEHFLRFLRNVDRGICRERRENE